MTKYFFSESKFFVFPHCAMCTVWKLQKFSLTHFWQKFRESNGFTKWITKELIWRNIFLVRVNFEFFYKVILQLDLHSYHILLMLLCQLLDICFMTNHLNFLTDLGKFLVILKFVKEWVLLCHTVCKNALIKLKY